MNNTIKVKKKLPHEGEAAKSAMKYINEVVPFFPKILKYYSVSNSQYLIARKYLNAEEIFQILCVAYIKEYCPTVLLVHIPNEGRRGNVEQAKIGLMGVKTGASDLLLINKAKVLHPLFWAELKWDSPVSQSQTDFLKFQIESGHHAAVYKKDFKKFVSDIKEWLNRD